MQFGLWRFLKHAVFALVLLSVFLASLVYYFCTQPDVCNLRRFSLFISSNNSIPVRRHLIPFHKYESNRDSDSSVLQDLLETENSSSKLTNRKVSYDKLTDGQSAFNIRSHDAIVFLHIQNTGGSVFTKHMIEDLKLERPCKCKPNRRMCSCYRPNSHDSPWFFSRYTTGWKCGVHPDWSELSNCIDTAMDEIEGKPVKRRYFFITMLRDPVKRFLSEFLHIRQGQNWLSSRHSCNGVEISSSEITSCFPDGHLKDITVKQFISCQHNLAINRQTRMLADISLVGCYNYSLPKDDRDLIMLASAKSNLHKMSFFGLSEYPKVSQYVFEATFNMEFRKREEPKRGHLIRSARKELFREITASELDKIKDQNQLDILLYHYAKELLFYRFDKLKESDPSFNENFKKNGNNEVSFQNWAEKEDFMSFLANDLD